VTPLQKVAMGLVIVFLRAELAGVDALPDPLGWVLVLAGVWALRTALRSADVLIWVGVLAALLSVVLVVPAVDDRLPPSGQWGASLPQTVFCLVLCGSLAELARSAGGARALRARHLDLLRWVFLAVGLGPVLVYGGGVDALAPPLAALAVLANVALVYLTFALSGLSRPRPGTGDPAAETEARPPAGS
jgi:hypothetical protein